MSASTHLFTIKSWLEQWGKYPQSTMDKITEAMRRLEVVGRDPETEQQIRDGLTQARTDLQNDTDPNLDGVRKQSILDAIDEALQ